MEWKLRLKGKKLPSNPLQVDIRDKVGSEAAAQDVASATNRKAEAFGKKGARGGGGSFKLPSSQK